MKHRKKTFQTPQVSQAVEVLLETNLLGGSIWQTSMVETAGQKAEFYYEDDEIVTSDNLWLD